MTERECPGGGPGTASDASATASRGDRADPPWWSGPIAPGLAAVYVLQLLLLGLLLVGGIYLTWENLRAVTE